MRHVICPPPPPARQSGYAGGQSALEVQICRLPGIPHADCAWHVCPPPWQHTVPLAQSADVAQIFVVPLGHVVPDWQVLEPPPSAPEEQHTLPIAQSEGAAQTWEVPVGHAV
jgi:hypothetical protein